MSELSSCKFTWFQKTNKVLSLLRSKSEDVTHQLDNAARCMDSVQSTVNDFVTSFNDVATVAVGTEPLIAKKRVQNKSMGYPKEDDIVCIKVLSGGLFNDHTFWCSYWFFNGAFNDNRLHKISDELGWKAKDLSAQKVKNIASEQLLFCYSSVHGLYLRAVILKTATSELEVRFIDLGRIEFISPKMTFYKLPEDNPKKHPFLKLHCTLYYENKINVFPSEANRCFHDYTDEKIVMARIIECSQCNGIPLFKIEIKTLDGHPPTNVNEEVLNKVLKHEEGKKRKKEEKIRKMKIEMERKEREQKEKERKETVKPISHDDSILGHEETPKSCHSKNKQKSQYASENKHAKEEQSTSAHHRYEGKLTENRERESQAASSSPSNKEDVIENGRHHQSSPSLSNKEDMIKNGQPRRRSTESVLPESVKSLKILNRCSSMPNIENVDPTSISLACVKDVCNGKVEHNKHATVEKAGYEQKDNLKEQTPRVELENDVYWVDLIPKEKRRIVPKKLPPLRNVFYNETNLRQARWYEIELMNVNELLNSESRMLFYALPITLKDLESSFTNNFLWCGSPRRSKFMSYVSECVGSSSQYIFILNDTHIMGIAKIESVHQEKIFVQYYCLSNIGEQKIIYLARNIYQIDHKLAKALILKYKTCLECNQSVPTFECYYPWCGIPPLMEFKKPIYLLPTPKHVNPKQILRHTSQKIRRSREDINDNKLQRSSDNQQQRSYDKQSSYDNKQQRSYENQQHNKDISGKRNGKKSLSHQSRQHAGPTQATHTRKEPTDHIIQLREELWDQDDADTTPGLELNPLPNQEVSLSPGNLEQPSLEELNCQIPCTPVPNPICEENVDTQEYDFSCNKINTAICTIVTSVDSYFSTASSVKSVACTAVPNPNCEETLDTQEYDFSSSKINTAICTIVTSVDSYFSTASSVKSVVPMTVSLETARTDVKSVFSTAASCESALTNATSMETALPLDNTVQSEFITIPLEDGSRPPSCYGYEANERLERLEEDWSVVNEKNNQSQKLVNGIKEDVASDTLKNSIDEKCVNSGWKEDARDANHMSEDSQKEPGKVLPRSPDKNVGFYDGSGMWYPDMDTAVLAFKSTIKVFNEGYTRKCKEETEMSSKDPERHYDENDNLSLHTEGLVECS